MFSRMMPPLGAHGLGVECNDDTPEKKDMGKLFQLFSSFLPTLTHAITNKKNKKIFEFTLPKKYKLT